MAKWLTYGRTVSECLPRDCRFAHDVEKGNHQTLEAVASASCAARGTGVCECSGTDRRLSSVLCTVTTCLVLSGCIYGPVRYKTLGHHKFATVELFRRAPLMAKPITPALGLPCDAVITALDTPTVMTLAFVGEYKYLRDEGDFAHAPPGTIGLAVLTSPITIPVWYCVALATVPFGTEDGYRDLFGEPGTIFRDEGPPKDPDATQQPMTQPEAPASSDPGPIDRGTDGG